MKTHDFSKLSATTPQDEFKFRIFQIVDTWFFKTMLLIIYKCLVIGRQDQYLFDTTLMGPHKYSEADIKSMLEYLVDNIYVVRSVLPTIRWYSCGHQLRSFIGRHIFIFIWSRICEIVSRWKQKLAVTFNHTYRNIDDVVSINNNNFQNDGHLTYPDELEMKDSTESDISACYLDILLNIDWSDTLTSTSWDKGGAFNFAIVNFLFLWSNISLSLPHSVYIHLIRYPRECSAYENFSKRGQLLTKKLILEGYNTSRLNSLFYKFYSHCNNFVCNTNYHWSMC
jgi:hypothetical protein